MKNDFIDDRLGDDSEQELQRLLQDALDAPPVPRSLRKRIEKGVHHEWNAAPEVAGAVRGANRWTRKWSSVPAVAAVVALIVCVVMLSSNSTTYAWSAVVDAIAERGVVEITGQSGVRWLSLADGILGVRTSETARIVDVRRKTVLLREGQASVAQRRPTASDWSAVDNSRLLVSFLIAGGETDNLVDQPNQLTGLKVVKEDWEEVTNAGEAEIRLRVQFATAAADNIELRMSLDPQSQLPLACEVSADRFEGALQMTYPTTSVAEICERDIPTALAIVDEPLATLAARQLDDTPESSTLARSPDPQAKLNVPEEAIETHESLAEAPSAWKPVAATQLGRQPIVDHLDRVLADLWAAEGVTPVAMADDEEILRRAYLDLVGRTPSVSEVRAYLGDRSSDRYEQLVERLLASPDHASHLATVWRTFLIPEGVDLTAFGGVEAFDRWLADRFASDDSYDEVVRSLLLAEGRLSRSGPLLFYSAVKLDPDQLAARTSRVFLGMRLECAQCHDHPFEPWTQEDFWGFAAFFAQISRPQAELETVSALMRVRDISRGEVMLPESEVVVSPKFLNNAGLDDEASARRQQLARWLTSAENPYFARAAANRVWGHMFGKGIVDPVDDFGVQNSPKSPELLDALAGHFVGSTFSLRELFRVVALSRAYRLSSGASDAESKRLECFAQMNVKTLTAEQVYDCVTVASLLDAPNDVAGGMNLARFGNSQREAFLQQFRTPAGRRTEYLAGIPQALTLMNGALIQGATGLTSSGLLNSLKAPFFTNRERVEVLYLATLSRRPRAAEWEILNEFVSPDVEGQARDEGLADILWTLLNSAEFTLNH